MALKKSRAGYHWPGNSTTYGTRKQAETAKSAVSSSSATWAIRWPARKGTEKKAPGAGPTRATS
ncbi:hypothetical protein SEA_DRYAD_5 [Streptomyces phage Dryad]|nr:hypothetical protein SEA_DRYAD_5 [Streptomyces phage Dryad]